MANAYRSVLKDAVNPTGNALPADVLFGKTFSNADGIDKTGTMVNNGAVTITLTAQDPSYTVPEGYHNGSGTVSFTPSGGDGADLVVTCSDAFAGSTISCTDGTTTFTEICPSASPYVVTFESIPTGTWTISGTVAGTIVSTSMTILDFTANLNAIPEGSTVLPTDDIKTWLHCADIWNKNYNTISQVLSDTSTLLTLISDSNAVDYMVRSTTWASSVSADSMAMTYIGANNYCSDTLLDDATWLEAICNSTYIESVLNVKVPTMTSATTPSGNVSAESYYSSELYGIFYPYLAFNGSLGSTEKWISNQKNTNSWLQYAFPTQVKIKAIDITTEYYNSGNRIRNFQVLAGNAQTPTEILLEETFPNASSSGMTTKIYPLSNDTAYRYYRLNVLDTYSGTIEVNELQLYGRSDV